MSSIGNINKGESGKSVRTKLNASITEANKVDDKLESSKMAGGTENQIFKKNSNTEGDYGWGNGSSSDIAAEIHAATTKATPVDADEIGLVDSADSWVLKKLTWANIKATLKTYFDTIYSTFSGSYDDLSDKPDLTVYAEKSNVLELDNTNSFTPDADYEPATKKYVDDNSGGSPLTTKGDIFVFGADNARLPVGTNGQTLTPDSAEALGVKWADASAGGHAIKNDGSAMADRAALNFKGLTIADDAANDETDIEAKFEGLTDVDPTGKADGSIWKYDGTSEKTEPQDTVVFDDIKHSTEATISANAKLTTILPKGYKIATIIILEDSGNAAGNISIGTAAAGTQIVNAETVGADADLKATLTDLNGYYKSKTNDTDLYVSSSAWGSGVISLYFTFIKN